MASKQSGAMDLLSVLWSHSQEATGHSWLKLNHAMHDGLFLAVRMGMSFSATDFGEFSKRFNWGRWCGDLEQFYATAVLYRHASAWQAFEAHQRRKPFIWADATLHVHTGDGPCGGGLARLVVGAEFVWRGEKVKVSSFNDAELYFTACSYMWTAGTDCKSCGRPINYLDSKLHHRYKITHADLSAAKKEAREKGKPNV